MSNDSLQRTVLVVVAALAVAVALTLVFTHSRLVDNPKLLLFVRLKLLVSTFNIVVLSVLAWTYVSIYRDLPNPFTFSLVLFCVALLLYALTSNPLLHVLLGFRGGVQLGPFTFIPDLFAGIATVILLYQSNE